MKRIWWIILGSTLVVVLLPIAIDWLIIGNSFPSNISNSDWVGFLGGYLGSIMGCIISLVGILWTINFTREQNRADRELQIRPVFDIRFSDGYDASQLNEWLGYGFLNITDSEPSMPNYSGGGILTIRNIGNGPATNICVSLSVESDSKDNREFQCGFSYDDEDKVVTANSIMPGNEASLGLRIRNTYKVPVEGLLRREPECAGRRVIRSAQWDVDHSRYPIPHSIIFTVRISFCDMLLNSYEQALTFNADYSCTIDYDYVFSNPTGASFKCEITLIDKGTTVMRRRR